MKALNKKDLLQLKSDMQLTGFVRVPDEESAQYSEMVKQNQKLPDDIRGASDDLSHTEFYKEVETELSSEEIALYLNLKNSKNINSMKNYLLFFVILAAIGIGIGLISLIV